MMDERLIVKKIKEIRLDRKMSLEKLADLTGLTKGYLSRIENSSKAPPVSTLAKLAEALGKDITLFFSENVNPPQPVDISIIKKNERLKVGGNEQLKRVQRGTSFGYSYEALAYRMPGKNMEPYIITINDDCPEVEFQHEGEEFIYMIEGRMQHIYGDRTYILEKGDSAYFNAGIPHAGRNIGKVKAKFLCIIYSYRRL